MLGEPINRSRMDCFSSGAVERSQSQRTGHREEEFFYKENQTNERKITCLVHCRPNFTIRWLNTELSGECKGNGPHLATTCEEREMLGGDRPPLAELNSLMSSDWIASISVSELVMHSLLT